MSAPNELRIFISSTFRDLQEEREHLVKKIFPEIRALCRERGVTFTEVDLRWGITEEEAEREGVIRICLDEIDRCRPFFIGILGERYGWTPSSEETGSIVHRIPLLADESMRNASITEMEIVHGVLANPAMAGHAFFYLRDRAATRDEFLETDAGRIERLDDLKRRIRRSGFPVREGFRSPAELGVLLEEDLRGVIENVYPAGKAPTPLEIERRSHAAFAASRRRAYIPDPERLKQFTDFVDARSLVVDAGSGDPSIDASQSIVPNCLVIAAESGLGKSSLISYMVEEYRVSHPTAFVIEYYVGASQSSGTAVAVMRQVIEEIRERFAISDDLPAGAEAMERSFSNWLFRAAHHAQQSGARILIAIDAVNQLDEAGRRLAWLPKTIPACVTLIVSTTPGECAEHLATYPSSFLRIAPITSQTVRRQIVQRYLGEFRKSITTAQIHRLTSDAKAASPLYLRVVAEELRLHGQHETLDKAIDSFADMTDLMEVFDRILARFEHDYGVSMVQRLMRVLWASRSGLSEPEMMDLAGVTRIDLSRLLFAIDYHFFQRDGLLGFFHDYLRRAVERRYLSARGEREDCYESLVTYFKSATPTLRSTLELLHALESVGDRVRLEAALTEIQRFQLMAYSAGRHEVYYEVLRLWSPSAPARIAEAYRESIDAWIESQSPTARQRAVLFADVATLYDSVGAWSEAEELYRQLLVAFRELNDRRGESHVLSTLSRLAMANGRMDEAEQWVNESETIAREIDDRETIAIAVGQRANLHLMRREYPEALACYREEEEIAREIDDRTSIAAAISNRANVYLELGAFSEALACLSDGEKISRELGDRLSIARGVGKRGFGHYARGEYAEALACYREQEAIARELGERSNVAAAVGNRGLVHCNRGEYLEALACYHEQETIARELGERRGIATAVGSRGVVHERRGEYDKALSCYREQELIAREFGDRQGVALAATNRGIVHKELGEYSEALACYRQAEQIARDLGVRIGIAIAVGNRGELYDERGEYGLALECFREAAEEHRAIPFPYGLTYWLVGCARVLLALSESDDPMPEFLADYIPGIDPSTWRAMALERARENATECLSISRELSKPDTMFDSQLTLARIDAVARGADLAMPPLQEMLANAVEDGQQAELRYWLWRIGKSEDAEHTTEEHRVESLRLHQGLIANTPKQKYRTRIKELTAGANPPETANSAE